MLIISRAEGQRKYQLGNKILIQHLKKCDENLRLISTYTTMFNLGDNFKWFLFATPLDGYIPCYV